MPYTDEQRKLVREVFVSFSDDKKSLTISQKKIREVLSTLGISVTDDEVFEMCTKMRIHKNASITFKRFMETLDQLINTVSAIDEFEAAFNSFDRNADGAISTADLKQVFNDMGMSYTEEELKPLLAAVDSKEADCRINKEQFIRFMKDLMNVKQEETPKQNELVKSSNKADNETPASKMSKEKSALTSQKSQVEKSNEENGN